MVSLLEQAIHHVDMTLLLGKVAYCMFTVRCTISQVFIKQVLEMKNGVKTTCYDYREE